jgi:hypothetical protein
MSNHEVMKTFEIVSVILYVIALAWAVRSRNPYWLGLVVGATTVYGFDWHWSTRGFFNATFNPDLIPTPGLVSYGMAVPDSVPPIIEPWSILLNYGFGFGPAIAMLLMATPTLVNKFGKAHYLIVWLMGVVGVAVYEIPVVHILKAWTYHQQPEYLFFGFPISNFFMGGNLIFWPWLFARCLRDWVPMPDKPGCSLTAATTWKGIVMGCLAMWSGFYVAGLLQLFWYSNATPWIEVGRPF